VRRNIGDCNTVNVTVGALIEIRFVGLLSMLIPIARPNTPASGVFEGNSEPPNAAEKINESKSSMSRLGAAGVV
jgi:hypothetical protein